MKQIGFPHSYFVIPHHKIQYSEPWKIQTMDFLYYSEYVGKEILLTHTEKRPTKTEEGSPIVGTERMRKRTFSFLRILSSDFCPFSEIGSSVLPYWNH